MMKSVLSVGLMAGLLCLGVVGLGTAGDSETAPVNKTPCIDMDHLEASIVIDKNVLLVKEFGGPAAKLTLSQPCSQMSDLDRVGFEFYGSARLCQRTDVKILHSRFDEAPLTCLISKIEYVTDAEFKKLSDVRR